MRTVVLGYIVRGPLGGLAWHHLQFCIGLQSLGHEVLFIEDSDNYPSCYDPAQQLLSADPTYGLRFISETFLRFGLAENWAYFDEHQGQWHGPCAESAAESARNADLLLNLSGVNPARPWLSPIPVRAFVDTDPIFTQIRYLSDPAFRGYVDWHTRHFTFGELLAGEKPFVLDDGIDWQPARQPVALDQWPFDLGPADAPLTTVMQWESYERRSFANITYGMKSESFAAIENLPTKVGVPLEIALGGESAPRARLRELGWRLVDPLAVTRTTESYQTYLRNSKGEFSVAKQGYVIGRTGWFSERSTGYLASGRPVITQDTGFSELLEIGDGLLAFTTERQAMDAIDVVNSDYAHHCRAARQIAERYFDANVVLTDRLSRL
jgi:hypothetical protein